MLWKHGDYPTVMDYLRRDVELTLRVAQRAAQQRSLAWMTRRGDVREIELPDGWLSVAEAWQLPPPDTSWMTDPPARIDFYDWDRDRSVGCQ